MPPIMYKKKDDKSIAVNSLMKNLSLLPEVYFQKLVICLETLSVQLFRNLYAAERFCEYSEAKYFDKTKKRVNAWVYLWISV